jgi:hypothetical protein
MPQSVPPVPSPEQLTVGEAGTSVNLAPYARHEEVCLSFVIDLFTGKDWSIAQILTLHDFIDYPRSTHLSS